MNVCLALLPWLLLPPCVSVAAEESPRIATRQEYAACLDAQDAISMSEAALGRQNDDLRTFALKLQAADELLSAQVRRHTPRTQAELASYNRAVGSRNVAAQQFNERSADLRKAQEALNDRIFRMNEQCATLLIPSDVKAMVDGDRRARGAK